MSTKRRRVKPLVWLQYDVAYFTASSVVGIYRITEYRGMQRPARLERPNGRESYHETTEAAQVTALSDYKERILSCLTDSSPADDRRLRDALSALGTIAHYSPASTIQPVQIARQTLVDLIGGWDRDAIDRATNNDAVVMAK